MANEITARGQLKALKSGASVSADVSEVNDMGASSYAMGQAVQTLATTTAEALSIPADVSTPAAWLQVYNLGPTGTVDFALDASGTSQRFAKLLVGQFMLLPPFTNTIYAYALSSTPSLQVTCVSS